MMDDGNDGSFVIYLEQLVLYVYCTNLYLMFLSQCSKQLPIPIEFNLKPVTSVEQFKFLLIFNYFNSIDCTTFH